MSKSNRKVVFILATIAIGLSLVMFVPFGYDYGFVENLVKFLVLPIVIACLNAVITGYKFKEYRPSNLFQSFVSYVPMFTYLIASFTYLAFLLSRGSVSDVYSFTNYIFIVIAFGLIASSLVIILNKLDKLNLKLSRNQVNVVDILIYVAFVVDILVVRSLVTSKYVGITLANTTTWHFVFGLILGTIILAAVFNKLHGLYLANEEYVSYSKEDIINRWLQIRDNAYYDAELVILYSMYNYTRERVSIQGDDEKITLDESNVIVNVDELGTLKGELKALKVAAKENEVKHAKIKEAYAALQNEVRLQVSTAELEALRKELSAVSASVEKLSTNFEEDSKQYADEKAALDEKVAALAEEKAKLISELGLDKPQPEKVEKPVEPKPEKVFLPSYEEMVQYASSLEHSELSVVANEKGNQHKFLVGKKPYLLMQKTNNDYRVTFLADEQHMFEYLQGYPALISVAKSPKGGNWLRIVNSGELDAEFLKGLIKGSLEAELAFEAALVAQKEAEKQAKLEAKALEKENREKLREAERIIARAKREEEKAALKAQKEAEKAALKAQKNLEQAQADYEKLVTENESEEEKALKEQAQAKKALDKAQAAAEKAQEKYEKIVAENESEEEAA